MSGVYSCSICAVVGMKEPCEHLKESGLSTFRAAQCERGAGENPAPVKPTCPQCGEPMQTMMRRISENSQSGVKLMCEGPELSYHEFRIFSLEDFAQFFVKGAE